MRLVDLAEVDALADLVEVVFAQTFGERVKAGGAEEVFDGLGVGLLCFLAVFGRLKSLLNELSETLLF